MSRRKLIRGSDAILAAAGVILGLVMGGTAGAFPDPASCGGTACTADGTDALFNNAGADNSAFGFAALNTNTTGSDNTASGSEALGLNTTGGDNTASGFRALEDNTTGGDNTASGFKALEDNTTGDDNTASGFAALLLNTMGTDNSADGFDALRNSTGNGNIGLGSGAGINLTTGDNNIDIGNAGVAAESGTIRIGDPSTASAAFVAGIFGQHLSSAGRLVLVDSTGHLGTFVSSARYKRDIRDMGAASQKLMQLRPVSFRYKGDTGGTVQYGLIAEEVAKVYPELVTHGLDGKIDGVHYELLPAMLLNELQRKDAQIAALQHRVATMEAKEEQLDALAARMNALERQVRAASPEHLASAQR